MRTTRILVGVLLVVGLGAPVAAMDLSEYRQDTYGPPNHYCNPSRSLSSNGAGTLADPWNMAQCLALPVAGDVVGLMPGISVDLPTTANSRQPVFQPVNSGTADNNRIVYVTRYAAVVLPNVETNPNRTELRHNGGAPIIVNGVGSGNGAPMVGVNGRNYITFDGFYVDMARAYMREDSGVIRPENSVGIHFRNFVIKGTTLTCASNCVVYRPNAARDTVLSNFRVYDFVNNPAGSATPQPALFSDQYGDLNVLIEHFEITNLHDGIFFKGSANNNTMWNYGTIQYGIIRGASSCFRFNAVEANTITTVQYNLCIDLPDSAGIMLSSETTPARNLNIHHNTVARLNGSSINSKGGIYARSQGVGPNVTMRDNLIDVSPGPFGRGTDFGEISSLPQVLNYNGYYKGGAVPQFGFNGIEYNNNFNGWKSATGRDTNSVVFTSSPFVDRAGGNFRVAAGHPARTASSTGGELGAYAGPRVPGVDTGGAPTGGSGGGAPAPPSGLRIVGF